MIKRLLDGVRKCGNPMFGFFFVQIERDDEKWFESGWS